MNEPATEQAVGADDFAVVDEDVTLTASLRGSFAICIYDALEESGALIHLRSGDHAAARDPELTDNTLLSNLALLERTLRTLQATSPRAQHWQAKLVAHIEDSPTARERFKALQEFISTYLLDSQVKLLSARIGLRPQMRIRFRPAMGQVETDEATIPEREA
jgi:chemotaxis receptor (MCP) glutamine deamidase CheD